jgi:hypothetical protein
MNKSLLLAFIAAILAASILFRGLASIALDDSDTSFFNRSGMRVHHDALTGCEYLGAGILGGAVTPRMARMESKSVGGGVESERNFS